MKYRLNVIAKYKNKMEEFGEAQRELEKALKLIKTSTDPQFRKDKAEDVMKAANMCRDLVAGMVEEMESAFGKGDPDVVKLTALAKTIIVDSNSIIEEVYGLGI